MRRLSLLVSVALGAGAAAITAQTPLASDAEVASGIKLVKAGDFERALLALDQASRSLAQSSAKDRDLAVAHLYMGIAYASLGHELLAKASFQRALKLDKSLRLDPKEFSPRVAAVFDSARKTSLAKPLGIVGAIGGGTLAVIAGGAAGGAAAVGTTIAAPTTMTVTTTTSTTTTTTTTTLPCSDTTPPQVSISFPAAGSTASGQVPLRSNASDNVAVTEVRFAVDERLVGVAGPPLFEILWDSRTASNGGHVLTARAFDACGNQGFSAPVMVDVRN